MRLWNCVAALLALVLALPVAHRAAANPLKSLYTTIELKSCRQVRKHRDGGAWICPGLEGYPVYMAEGDLRTFVSIGPAPQKRRAATQTLGPFNSVFRGRSNRATLEWRFVRRDGKVLPFATITRYFTQMDGRTGQVLVVTKVASGDSCHVAYIDALANPDAIALARRVADTEARRFDCKDEPRQVGRTGRSPM